MVAIAGKRATSTGALGFRLGLQPLAFVHVVVVAAGQLRVIDVLPAPEANDNRFHTTDLKGMNPIIALQVARAKCPW
jgi:hypothetical protein